MGASKFGDMANGVPGWVFQNWALFTVGAREFASSTQAEKVFWDNPPDYWAYRVNFRLLFFFSFLFFFFNGHGPSRVIGCIIRNATF